MQFYVGNTDSDWYEFVSSQDMENVNFWNPGSLNFRVLNPGELFLFRLKSPINKIVGGAFFVNFQKLPLSTIWQVFGRENGTESYDSFRQKIFAYRARLNAEKSINPLVGCTVLTSPFFLPQHLWIEQPQNWQAGIVRGKTYSTDDEVGSNLWNTVQSRLQDNMSETVDTVNSIVTLRIEQDERYRESIGKRRLGQSAFRTMVINAYDGKCAMTREKTLPVLIAGHIKPYSKSGAHDVRNGLLLRSDIHTLFDQGYITVTNDFKIEVSPKIREEFQNGKTYYTLHGIEIYLPEDSRAYPHYEYLEWHNNEVYKP